MATMAPAKGMERMKKVLFIVLFAVAIPLYTYNVLLLTRMSVPWLHGTGGKNVAATRLSFAQLLVAATPPKFERTDRDPFSLYKTAPAVIPEKRVKKAVPKPAKKEVVPPALTITGIMWNPGNPVAMLKIKGGGTKTVKQGQEIDGGITVVSIGKKNVVVTKDGEKFTFER